MKQTLFIIPPDWFQTWLIGAWLVLGLLVMLLQLRERKVSAVLQDSLAVYLIGAGIIYFVLPRMAVPVVNPADPLGELVPGGLAIRGYGVFLMLAILLSMAMVIWRCRETGLDVDQTLTLCFVMIVTGLAGARLFYVIQKWEDFAGKPWVNLLDMTQGGLVVYGSLIGGLLGAVGYFHWKRLPVRRTLDVLAPAMILGLAIGRLGCLMNGCCYGGVCSDSFPLGLSFPVGSPPYMRQLEDGSLLGLQARFHPGERYPVEVEAIPSSSPLDSGATAPGDHLAIFPPDPLRLEAVKSRYPDVPLEILVVNDRTGQSVIPVSQIPDRSLRIHPTQIYASINAFLLCGFLYFYFPWRRFDGQTFSILMILYPISRFLLEAIRTDEIGQFGTQLSISQWISMGALGLGIGMYAIFALAGKAPASDPNLPEIRTEPDSKTAS